MGLFNITSVLAIIALLAQVSFLTDPVHGNPRFKKDQLVSEVESGDEPDGGESCSNDYVVDHLKLVLSWNPGVCATGGHNCKRFRTNFVIQGLRPHLRDVNSMRCCTKEKFRVETIEGISEELKENWPALEEPQKDEEVWSEEWEKYGRCAGRVKGVKSIFSYFTFALKNFGKLKLKQTLASKSLYPTNHRTYQGFNILRVLADHYRVRAELKCAQLGTGDSLALTGINFCYDTNLKAIDCPYTDSNCTGDLLILKS